MKTLLMLVDRPTSPTTKHAAGETVTIADDLAEYYLSTGAARYAELQQITVIFDRNEDDGNVIGMSGTDGAAFFGAPESGAWMKVPSIFRLRLTGTGTCTLDSRDSLGNIISAVASYTAIAATDQIEFPFAGVNAVEIRATLTGTCTAEVI